MAMGAARYTSPQQNHHHDDYNDFGRGWGVSNHGADGKSTHTHTHKVRDANNGA